MPAGHCDGNRPTLGRIEPDQVSDDLRELAYPGPAPARAAHPRPARPGRRRLRRRAGPTVVVVGAPPNKGAQGAGQVEVEALAMVGSDEVERVALSEQVGAVAGDPVSECPHGDPFASERNPTTTRLNGVRIAGSLRRHRDQNAGRGYGEGLQRSAFGSDVPATRRWPDTSIRLRSDAHGAHAAA